MPFTPPALTQDQLADLRIALLLFVIALGLRLVDHRRYRDTARALRALRLTAIQAPHTPYFEKRDDRIFAVLPYVWLWLDVIAAQFVARAVDHWAGYLVLALVVAGRFRGLQEVGHIAVHGGLCASKPFQWAVADLAFTWPLGKARMAVRHVNHCRRHHPNPNRPDEDPNLIRFAAVGFVPGLSRTGFAVKLLHPLLPAGWVETMTTLAHDLTSDRGWRLAARLAVMAGVAGAMAAAFGWQGLVFGHLVPLLLIYPLFSWISVIAEHRWYARADSGRRMTDECTNGRPTDYSGISGWIVRQFVSPYTDSWHLAHSLYPFARWNHLPAIDAALKARNPDYARHLSHGLLIPGRGRPSALSELRERMCGNATGDLADWAAPPLSPPPLAGSDPA
ncbi:fatty acid desaturase [Tistrella mobilis]